MEHQFCKRNATAENLVSQPLCWHSFDCLKCLDWYQPRSYLSRCRLSWSLYLDDPTWIDFSVSPCDTALLFLHLTSDFKPKCAWCCLVGRYLDVLRSLLHPWDHPFRLHLAVRPILGMDLPGDIFLLQMAAPGLLRWISHTKSEARLFFLARILLGHGFQIPHCRLQRMLENTWLSSLLTLSQHLLSNNL